MLSPEPRHLTAPSVCLATSLPFVPQLALEGSAFSPGISPYTSLASPEGRYYSRSRFLAGTQAHWLEIVFAHDGTKHCRRPNFFSLLNLQLVMFGAGPERHSPNSVPGL